MSALPSLLAVSLVQSGARALTYSARRQFQSIYLYEYRNLQPLACLPVVDACAMCGVNGHAILAEVFCRRRTARTSGEQSQVPGNRGGFAPSRDELTSSGWASNRSMVYVSDVGLVFRWGVMTTVWMGMMKKK